MLTRLKSPRLMRGFVEPYAHLAEWAVPKWILDRMPCNLFRFYCYDNDKIGIYWRTVRNIVPDLLNQRSREWWFQQTKERLV